MDSFHEYEHSSSTRYDHVFKLIVIGDTSVGKTSLLTRFTERSFHPFYSPTIGIDFRVKSLKINNKLIKLQIWDTSGNERFQAITSLYYKNADGFVIVYDSTNPSSLKNVQEWYNRVSTHCSKANEFDFKNRFLIVGNKIDIMIPPFGVSTDEGKTYAERLGLAFTETSIKSNINVNDVFYMISRTILQMTETIEPYNIEEDESLFKGLLHSRKKKKLLCC